MAATVLVHIGHPKTGTKSIQAALVEARRGRMLGTTCYATPDGSQSHGFLANLYLPHDRRPRYIRSRHPVPDRRLQFGLDRYRRRLFGRVRAAPSAVLSTENLTRLSPAEVRLLRRDLESAGGSRFHIVMYVRDPADYYLSQSQQELKASSRLRSPVTFRHPFRRILETWDGCFPGDVIVRRYSTDVGFDVIEDFSTVLRSCLGVGLPRLPERLNQTISAEGMEIVQRYRAACWPDHDDVFTADTDRLVEWLQQSRAVTPQTTAELRPEIAAWIRTAHRDDAEWMRDRYGVDPRADTAVGIAPPPEERDCWQVADIVRHVDPDVVTALLLEIASKRFRAMGAGHSFAARVAAAVAGRWRTVVRRRGV